MIDKKVVDPSNTLILCDIEGSEYELINSRFLELFKQSHLIIELHSFNDNLKYKKEIFLEQVSLFHNFEIHFEKGKKYNYSELNNYTDNERLLILSEGRAELGQWLYLSPK